jgi:DNA segregation ATPase FtsK/SpoIIIE, S-DNA-T family
MEFNNYMSSMENAQDAVFHNFLEVPIGQVGNRPILWAFGDKSGSYNAFIAGAVGSGKTSFLQNLLLTIAEKHSPDDFHFLIMDYKLGNDFYVFKSLAHLEFLLLDNSRFDKLLAVLQQFWKEKEERSALFQALSNRLRRPIPNVATYNRLAAKKMPYKLLIIDEIYELFLGNGAKSMDSKIKTQLQNIFQLIVRQGRAFGLHIIICTQNLEGFDLGNGIMQQIKLRVAFQLASHTECRHILDINNTIPLDLERFEAVMNTQYGRSDANDLGKKYNSIFKSPFVGDIGKRIQAINEKWQAQGYMPFEKTIVEKGRNATDKIEIIEADEGEDFEGDEDDFVGKSWIKE